MDLLWCILYIFLHRYDPERVPAYPMLLEERKKYCTLSDYYPTHKQPCEQQGVGSAQESNSESSVDGERKGPLSEVVDVQLTRRDSHLFLASVIRSTSSIADSSQLNKVAVVLLYMYT